jgi:addiction module HigA family antidote
MKFWRVRLAQSYNTELFLDSRIITPLMLILSIIIKENNMVMHNPPHPGEVIRELCISPLNLTVTDAAKGLGVSRKTLSALLNGHFGISPDMAIRLSMAFGGSAESWMIQQAQFDLWQAKQKAGNIKVTRFAA